MHRAGIDINTDWQEGERVLNNVNLKANSERNGAFSGDSSTNSKSFEGKVHLHRSSLSDSKDVAKVRQNSETTKDKGQKRALERESRVRQSLMEGKLLWKRAEIASDYSDLNQGLYKQPGMLSEPAVQVRVHPQSDLSTAKIRRIIGIIPIFHPKT